MSPGTAAAAKTCGRSTPSSKCPGLIVAREYGILNDTERIRDLIRTDNLQHDGWSTPRRGFDDRQPRQLLTGEDKRRRYASLMDTSIIETLTADV